MKHLTRLLAVASAALFIVGSALAQNTGTVTNHAFALGKGAGKTGYTSLLCGSAQLAVGQAAADPICRTLSGDVTIDASGVTAIGTAKVTNAMLAAMAANTTKCNATAGSASPTDCTASTMRTNIGVVIGTNVEAWDQDLDCLAALSGTGVLRRTGAGTCSNGTAVTNAELATMAAYTLKGNATGSAATPTDIDVSALTLKAAPIAADIVLIQDSAASNQLKKATVGTLASAGSVSSVNGATGAITIKAEGGSTVTNSGGTTTVYDPGGGLNKFRNASMDIWQRGTSVSIGTSGNYGPDGWKVLFTGSTSVTASQANNVATTGSSRSALAVTGATSNTGIKVAQRIESFVAAPLAGATVTVQFKYYQQTGSTQTPKISTCFASATDNFGTCTADLASTSLTACAASTVCTESYTFTASSSAVNGYEVTLDCNAAFTGAQSCYIITPDIRVTPGVTTGINANPPPPELRSVGVEMPINQRYLYVLGTPGGGVNYEVLAIGNNNSTTIFYGTVIFPQVLRANPSITYQAAANYVGVTAGSLAVASAITTATSSAKTAQVQLTISGGTAGQAGNLPANATANAFTTFSAEL